MPRPVKTRVMKIVSDIDVPLSHILVPVLALMTTRELVSSRVQGMSEIARSKMLTLSFLARGIDDNSSSLTGDAWTPHLKHTHVSFGPWTLTLW